MYHSVSDHQAMDVHPYYCIETSVAVFRKHMAFLHDNGYSVIALHDVLKPLNGARSASKPVVLTFDDAFQDFYTNAFPVLSQYSFPRHGLCANPVHRGQLPDFQGKAISDLGEIRDCTARESNLDLIPFPILNSGA